MHSICAVYIYIYINACVYVVGVRRFFSVCVWCARVRVVCGCGCGCGCVGVGVSVWVDVGVGVVGERLI